MSRIVWFGALLVACTSTTSTGTGSGSANTSPTDSDDCERAVGHVFAILKAGDEALGAMSAEESAARQQVETETVAQCRREGLTPAQRDCILAVKQPQFPPYDKNNKQPTHQALEQMKRDLGNVATCPAIAAKRPSWLQIP